MLDGFLTELRARAAAPLRPNFEAGMGIVICAGGSRLFTCAYVLVRVLRETLGCSLPIQIWHFGGEELSSVMRKLLMALDVELVDATAVLPQFPADIQDGWQLKPYAILHSRFSEVLFLDADQVPVRDPICAFDMPEYRKLGAVFWPDIVDLRSDNPIWKLVGLPGQSCVSWDSGQILIDKARHWASLQTALYLNEQADVVYRMIYGDKDTFLIAWQVTGASAAVVPHRPFNDYRVLVQRDFAGAPLFQHRTGAKWTYHVSQYKLAGFAHMDACLGFLGDLRKAWNGRMFFPPDRSLAAHKEEDRLEQVRSIRISILGESDIDAELLGGHQFGVGRSIDRQNWYVAENEIGPELVLHNGDQITYRLRPANSGLWTGDRLLIPAEVRMTELPAGGAGNDQKATYGLVDSLVAVSGFLTTNSKESRAALISTFGLLLKAEPGLRPEIYRLARRSVELAEIANEVLAAHDRPGFRPVTIATDVIKSGYDVAGGTGL
jgi:hypothetical protein